MSQNPAIRIAGPGGPKVMQLQDVTMPQPGPGQIQVEQQAIGVNYIDTYHRSGLYPLDMPSGIGLEAAGTVSALGDDVTGWAVGDRVTYCTGPIGAYAQFHTIAADRAIHLPREISFEAAASMMLKGLTAQYLIRQIHPTQKGDTVLFHAGAGGVGQIALQWLRHLGATTIATVGSAEKADIATSLGADHVINYREEDIAERVRAIVPEGLPVVFDGVGKDTFVASLDCLRPRGLLVSFGNASGPVRDVDLSILAAKGSLFVTRPTLFNYVPTAETLQTAADDLFATINAGGIALPQPKRYALADASQAHEDLEGRRTTGSLILVP